MITHLRHTTLGRTPLDEGPARRRDLYLTTLTTYRHPCLRWDSSPRSLDRTATGIGSVIYYNSKILFTQCYTDMPYVSQLGIEDVNKTAM
jgi:hypothetical protein